MRVISQDGMIDVTYELSILQIVYETISLRLLDGSVGVFVMAKYSTPEKAKKAMQKLHEAYSPEPLFIQKDASPDKNAARGEINWAQALDEIHSGMFVRPIPDSPVEQVYTGNIIFRFPAEDKL